MLLKNQLKRLASHLPKGIQNELKRAQFAFQIRRKRFETDEAEYVLLKNWVSEGDLVLDVGANIGHYTMKLSELVGQTGRVIAFEPVPETFELLAANAAKSAVQNITLLNVAASDRTDYANITVPKFETGLDNYYMAHLSSSDSSLKCLTLAIDDLNLPTQISLIKIDAEGHELPVLKGLEGTLTKSCPILIVEDNSPQTDQYLQSLGYQGTQEPGSSNKVYQFSSNVDLHAGA